jgi:molybdopterin synthase sulfur carrier subunit
VRVTVRIPSAMRSLTGDAGTVQVEAETVGGALRALTSVHPGVAGRLYDDEGKLRRFVNVFVGDEDIRFHEGLDTPVADGGTVSILPAVAGG